MKKDGLKYSPHRKHGYSRLVFPKNSRLRMIEFGTVHLQRGDSITLSAAKREFVLTLLRGRCTLDSGSNAFGMGPRKNIFEEPAWAVYARAIPRVRLTARSRLEALLSSASVSSKKHVIELIEPSAVVERVVGSDTYERRVRTIVGEDFPAERLLVGETINAAGKWSSYPPHRHERDALPYEAKLEEVYFYKFENPKGFGMQRIYTDNGRIDETHTVRENDVCVLPRGYHPVAATPHSRLYYFWALAGRKRKMCVRVDPDFE